MFFLNRIIVFVICGSVVMINAEAMEPLTSGSGDDSPRECSGDKIAFKMALEMENNVDLNTLNLSYMDIGPKGAKRLAQALKNPNCRLKQLILSGNPIGDRGAHVLSGALKQNSSLEKLSLFFCGIGDLGVRHICLYLSSQPGIIKELGLNVGTMSEETWLQLTEALADNLSS